MAALDRWLEKSQHAAAWHKRLDTDALRHELAKKGSPDLAVVERWLERLTADAVPHAPILALRRSVEGWLALESLPEGRHLPTVAISILTSPTRNGGAESEATQGQREPSRAELKSHLIALAAMLSWYAKSPNDDLERTIDEELTWLETAGAADTLVDAVRQYYGHPNVWIDISEDLLDDPVARTVDRGEPVSDVILGTPLSGHGRLRAQSALAIQPDSDRAVLKIMVHGQVETQTTGRRGPARIHSRSTTTFRAEKRLVIEESGLRVLPTVCNAELSDDSSNVSAVKGGLRGRIVRRIAQRRWEASREAAHEEALRHVEQRVAAAVDREADELIGRLDRLVIAPMLVLANSGGSKKNAVQFRSEKGMLRIGVRRGRLGAPPGMPKVDEGRLFAVRVHSSLVNRTGSLALIDAVTPSFSELSFVTPSTVLESVALLTQPGQLFRVSFATDSRPIPVSNRLWQRLAWKWIDQTVAPRLDGGGIVLRDGRWGRLMPGELGGEWPLLGWQPIADRATDVGLPATVELSTPLKTLR